MQGACSFDLSVLPLIDRLALVDAALYIEL